MAKKGKMSMKERILKRNSEKKAQRMGGKKFEIKGDVNFLKIKKGTMLLDIIPYPVSVDTNPEVDKGVDWYQRTIYTHRNIGIEDNTYICPKTIGKPCPICEEYSALKKDPDADADSVKALKPQEREIFNVVDQKEPEKGVQLWDISYFCFGKKLDIELEENPDMADFSEVEGGKTLKVRFKEEAIGKTTTFLDTSRIDFMDREDIDQDILDKVIDLDSILNVMDYDALNNIFMGVTEENIQEEEEEEPEEEEEEPEEEEEEKKEVKKTKKDRKKKEEKKKESDCPEGFVFGEEFENHDECDTCDKWEECSDTFDKIEADSKKKK